jgi:hypothetical protein
MEAAAAREMIAKGTIKKGRKILFMLDLIALPRIFKTLATWMQSCRAKGIFILPRAGRRMKKTRGAAAEPSKSEGQGLVGEILIAD